MITEKYYTITEINKSKTLNKQVSWKCECKFGSKNVIQIKSGITINVGVSVYLESCNIHF